MLAGCGRHNASRRESQRGSAHPPSWAEHPHRTHQRWQHGSSGQARGGRSVGWASAARTAMRGGSGG